MEVMVKYRALDYLVEHRRQTRQAPYTVETDVTAAVIGRRLGVPLHGLVHALWDLQKQDHIRFRERKYSRGHVGRGDLDRFVITAQGFAMWRDLKQGEAVAVMRSDDPSDVADVVASADARMIASDLETERKAKPNGHANGHAVDVPAFMANVRGEDAPGPEAPPEAPAHPVLEPLLVQLLARYRARERVREAAAALEAAGMEDQALAVMEQASENATEDAMARHLLGCPYAIEP